MTCQDITVELDAAGNYLTPGEVVASSDDNCAVASISFNDPITFDTGQLAFNGLPNGDMTTTPYTYVGAPLVTGDVSMDGLGR